MEPEGSLLCSQELRDRTLTWTKWV